MKEMADVFSKPRLIIITSKSNFILNVQHEIDVF
jgi:hypothetical protein